MIAGSFAAVIASGLKRAAAGEEGPACAWDGGDDIEQLARDWSQWSRPIQEASKELLANPGLVLNTQARNQAAQLLRAVNGAPTQKVLMRGMGLSERDAKALLNAVNTKMTLPLSSFTADRSVAESFAMGHATGGTPMPVFIEVRGAHGLNISSMVPEDIQWAREHLVAGDFIVTSVERTTVRGVGSEFMPTGTEYIHLVLGVR